MTIKYPCSTCDYSHVVKLPDGTIKEFKAGSLKELDEDKKYDETVSNKGVRHGFFTELTGGNLGKLVTCLEYTQEVDEVEILVEGRWMKVKLKLIKERIKNKENF